jgi:hypothetical protein
MADLKRQLDQRAGAFDWEPDAMQRMFERSARRQRRRRVGTAIVALAIGLAGVGAIARSYGPSSGDVGGATLTSPRMAATIPDGVYWTRPLTRSQIVETLMNAGFSRSQAQRWFFSKTLAFHHWIREGLVVQDGFWFQTAKADTGKQEAGWSGNYRALGGERIRATAYGCTITYGYTFEGRELTLHVLSERGSAPDCGHGDTVAQTAIFDPAPFALSGAG